MVATERPADSDAWFSTGSKLYNMYDYKLSHPPPPHLNFCDIKNEKVAKQLQNKFR